MNRTNVPQKDALESLVESSDLAAARPTGIKTSSLPAVSIETKAGFQEELFVMRILEFYVRPEDSTKSICMRCFLNVCAVAGKQTLEEAQQIHECLETDLKVIERLQ